MRGVIADPARLKFLSAGIDWSAKTKNNEAVAIPMNAAVTAVLDQLETRRNGSTKDVKSSFRAALKKAKTENLRFHDLRHCCASWLMMKGADLNDVRQILGHKSIVVGSSPT